MHPALVSLIYNKTVLFTYQCQSGGKGQGFDKGSGPVVGTFDYRQVPGQGLLNFL